MKGATDLLFTNPTYYKKREGLGSPGRHFTRYPSVLLTEFFSEKNIFLKKSKPDLYLQKVDWGGDSVDGEFFLVGE